MRRLVGCSVAMAIASLAVSLTTPAQALPFTVSFTATFDAGAPVNPVSGSFTYEASSITGPILALDAVNLTIAGFTYSLANVGFGGNVPTAQEFGGTLNGIDDIGPDTNDFFLIFDATTATAETFAYSTPTDPTGFSPAISFSAFAITPAAIPEPESWTIILTGLVGLSMVRGFRRV
jgi:hypothetical protein